MAKFPVTDTAEDLKRILAEQDKSAKMLVRRDLELLKANAKLQDLDRAKSEFISVAAHQMRTPLSAVKWVLKMFIDGDMGTITDEQKTMILRAYESNDRMINIVNDLLDVDHIESGKLKYEFVPIQAEDFVDSALVESVPGISRKGVSVVFNRAPRLLPRISGDPKRLRMVFQNLLDNAVKYTPTGGVVTIALSEEPGKAKISVADTGIGIPKDQQDEVFKKFFRARNAKKFVTDGSGLGLFVAREIVAQHGGELSFVSEEGKGTTFSFTVPFYDMTKA